jgi:hypothetical protein
MTGCFNPARLPEGGPKAPSWECPRCGALPGEHCTAMATGTERHPHIMRMTTNGRALGPLRHGRGRVERTVAKAA